MLTKGLRVAPHKAALDLLLYDISPSSSDAQALLPSQEGASDPASPPAVVTDSTTAAVASVHDGVASAAPLDPG